MGDSVAIWSRLGAVLGPLGASWEFGRYPGGPGAGASGRRRALPNERKVAFGGGGGRGKGGKGQKQEDDDEGEYSLQRRRPGQTTTKSLPTRSRIGLRPWGALRRRPRKRATALGSASAQTQKAGYCLGECFGADPESKLNCPTATTWLDDDETASNLQRRLLAGAVATEAPASPAASRKNNFFGRYPTPPRAPGRQERVRGGWLSHEP